MIRITHLSSIASVIVLALSACTVAKLEARLEANPQCKDIINPKTGALMPCPGTDKSFYVAAGLEEAKKPKAIPVVVTSTDLGSPANARSPSASDMPEKAIPLATSSSGSRIQTDCKPKLHQKTGGMLPCPPAD